MLPRDLSLVFSALTKTAGVDLVSSQIGLSHSLRKRNCHESRNPYSQLYLCSIASSARLPDDALPPARFRPQPGLATCTPRNRSEERRVGKEGGSGVAVWACMTKASGGR